jgi:type II secretory ATPase GspE/PulE/Tfp pilus assembly ATPase PilB-like protein
MTEPVAALAAARATHAEIARAAAEDGMRSLWEDGLATVAAGVTSLEELARVIV